MRRIAVLIFCILISVASAASQDNPRTPTADLIASYGHFDGQEYRNTYLNFSILAPGAWTFYTYSQIQSLVATNRTKNESESAKNTQVLFQATPSSLAGQEKSALFSSGIERLVKTTTVDAYIEANKKLVLSAPNLTLAKDKYPLTFGGVKFMAFDVEGLQGDRKFRQRYIATIRKNVALFFVVTLYDPKQDAIVDFSLQTIKFSK